MAHENRTRIYALRLNDDEDARAKRIAEHLGMPMSTLFRVLLLEKERALGLEPAKKGKR
jgi:antitoxin component of RelBE/YafQ-DinJ toxin-antitoxin module